MFVCVREKVVRVVLVSCGWRMWPASHLPLRSKSAHIHAGVAAACPCDRTLRAWIDVFPCQTAARGLRTGVAVRGFTRRGPPRSGGNGSPGGAYLYAGLGREQRLH